VPGSDVVGVVALLGVARGLPEVLEVASGPFGVVLVVAGDGLGAPLEAPPRRLVASLEVRCRAPRVRVVVQGEDRPVDALDQFDGSLVGLGAAAGDVARGDDLLRGGVSKPQPTAMRTATVATIIPVAVLLLPAPTPSITCRLSIRIRYPREPRMARIPVTRPSRVALTNSQERAYSPECLDVEFSALPLLALVHRSAWKRYFSKVPTNLSLFSACSQSVLIDRC
jgi:hypothetical protein